MRAGSGPKELGDSLLSAYPLKEKEPLRRKEPRSCEEPVLTSLRRRMTPRAASARAAEPPSALRAFASMSPYQMFIQPSGLAALGAAFLAVDSKLKIIRREAVIMGVIVGGSAGLLLGFMQSYHALLKMEEKR